MRKTFVRQIVAEASLPSFLFGAALVAMAQAPAPARTGDKGPDISWPAKGSG